MNKSEQVRTYLVKHPESSISEVAKGLNKQEITVHPSMISTIRAKMYREGLLAKPTNGRKNKKVANVVEREQQIAIPEATVEETYFNDLFQAKRVADSLGGLEKATRLMNDLHRLIHG